MSTEVPDFGLQAAYKGQLPEHPLTRDVREGVTAAMTTERAPAYAAHQAYYSDRKYRNTAHVDAIVRAAAAEDTDAT